MKPISFPEQTLVFAKDQPEYIPLPAHRSSHLGRATFCWQLTWRERLKLLVTGKIWHQALTFGQPLQPQLLMVEKPFMFVPPPEREKKSYLATKAE